MGQGLAFVLGGVISGGVGVVIGAVVLWSMGPRTTVSYPAGGGDDLSSYIGEVNVKCTATTSMLVAKEGGQYVTDRNPSTFTLTFKDIYSEKPSVVENQGAAVLVGMSRPKVLTIPQSVVLFEAPGGAPYVHSYRIFDDGRFHVHRDTGTTASVMAGACRVVP